MREILVGKRMIAKKEYKYSLLVQELWQEKKLICEEYGIKIRSELEESAILGITVSLNRIGELIQLLLRNRVTPTSLLDVIEDWL